MVTSASLHWHSHRHRTQPPASEAGSRRWLVLGAFLLVSATTQLMWLTYAPIAPELHTLGGLSESQVVALSAVFPLLYIVISVPVGQIIDRYGFRVAILIGAVLTAGGAAVRIASPSFGVLLAGSLIIALGQPFVLNSATTLNAAWFPGSEAGRANGLFVASLFAGMIVSLGLTPLLFSAFGGTSSRTSLTWVAVVYAAIAFVALALFAILGTEREGARIGHTAAAGSWSSVTRLARTPRFIAPCWPRARESARSSPSSSWSATCSRRRASRTPPPGRCPRRSWSPAPSDRSVCPRWRIDGDATPGSSPRHSR
jgi:MFS family permease